MSTIKDYTIHFVKCKLKEVCNIHIRIWTNWDNGKRVRLLYNLKQCVDDIKRTLTGTLFNCNPNVQFYILWNLFERGLVYWVYILEYEWCNKSSSDDFQFMKMVFCYKNLHPIATIPLEYFELMILLYVSLL